MEQTTSPRMVCLQGSHVVSANVIKNREPLVLVPALVVANFPGLMK